MTEGENMDLESFTDRLDRLGADLARWPGSDRDAAGALLAISAPARAALAASGEMEALLAATRAAPRPGLHAIVARATATRQLGAEEPGAWRRYRGVATAACVVAALAGFALGFTQGSSEMAGTASLLRLAFGPGDLFDGS
jgi:hypothetical protein